MKYIWPNGWTPTGHYSPGIISGNTLYISGQLPFDHHSGKMNTGSISIQTQQALENLDAILTAAGLTRNSVVLCRIYIPDIKYWDTVNSIYATFFGSHKPARAVIPTRELHHGALIEIEATAELEEI